jgi:hypothetical protein
MPAGVVIVGGGTVVRTPRRWPPVSRGRHQYWTSSLPRLRYVDDIFGRAGEEAHLQSL